MAYCFGDSFDLYAVPADAIAGYWDSGTVAFNLLAGRFGGRCLSNSGSGTWVVKSSGVNDAVHHLVCAFQQTAALSGTTLGAYLQLSDGATNQCCIVFRSDGAILLTSATPAGTVLATYTGAVTLVSQWFAFEFELVINNTTGRFRVRKNGNTSDDFDSGATLNTRPGANSYANKLTLGQNVSVVAHYIDDLLWRSDASSVPFVGDIRCYVRMPASDASVVFSRSPASATGVVVSPLGTSVAPAANNITVVPFVASLSGIVTGGIVQGLNVSTGHFKFALYDSTRTVLLATSAEGTNLVVGANAFTFPSPPTLTRGNTYHIAYNQDATLTYNGNNPISRYTTSSAYSAFPLADASSTGTLGTGGVAAISLNITTNVNAGLVNEAQQDGVTTYVYSSNVGDTDLYNIASIGVTPASTIAVTTRAFMQKSDAGSRSGKVVLKSGGTTVDSGSAALSTTWAQMYRTDTVDPATGTAWTAVGVNAAQIGVAVTA